MSTTELDLTAVDSISAETLVIADLTPFGVTDWPGRIAPSVLQGCPWGRTPCPWPALHDPDAPGRLSWAAALERLEEHRGLVDGVVFSGGEPTRQLGLVAAMREVRNLGFGVGLTTAGAHPSRLATVLPEVDWVGIEILASPESYDRITGVPGSGVKAWTSLELIQHSGVPSEVRLKVDPNVHTRDDVCDAVREIVRRGAHAPVLQEARPIGKAPEFVKALRGRGLYDVIDVDDFPDLERR